ncbi:MAG: hypothetical protein EBY18_19945 [Alphaproteobacteria bacterium]|nr:hypothetical protein [Alphaproteobacteria bacterium]
MYRLGACLKGFIMNGADLIKGVDFLNREKNIPRDLIFSGIEKAVRKDRLSLFRARFARVACKLSSWQN